MKTLTEEQKHKRARIVFIILSILCVASIVFCVFFPRGTFIFVALTLILCWIISLSCVRSKGRFSFPIILYPVLVIGLFIFAYLFMIIFFMEYFFCERRPWEYEPEIEFYKQDSNDLFYFPDELPESAKNVEWIVVPSAWQAKGCKILSFEADEAYIQQCINNHRGQYEQYHDIEDLPEEYRDDFYESARIDLYAAFSEEYYDESYQSYCEAFSVSDFDATNKILEQLLPERVTLSVEEVKTATHYRLDHQNEQGMIVVDSTNRIIFYRDYK